jgi:hypothetical protein
MTKQVSHWDVYCPICKGKGELLDAVQAWDIPDAPVPECPHCVEGTVNVSSLVIEIVWLRSTLDNLSEWVLLYDSIREGEDADTAYYDMVRAAKLAKRGIIQ